MNRRRLLVAVCVWAALVLSLWVSHARPAAFLLGGIVAVVVTIIFATIDLTGAISSVRWSRRSDLPVSTRGTDPRVSSLRHQVYRAWLSGSPQISNTLVDLLDDRLITNHHVTRADDPVAADKLLTASLRRLVAGPRRQTATVRELRQILTDIEAL